MFPVKPNYVQSCTEMAKCECVRESEREPVLVVSRNGLAVVVLIHA